MKLCSRPQVEDQHAMGVEDIAEHILTIVALEGLGQNGLYKKVLVLGACGMLVEQGIIEDYQIGYSSASAYGLVVSVRLPRGGIVDLYI